MSGPRIGLLFGGDSPEHEVSLMSARGVAAALDPSGLSWLPLAVTDRGHWLSPERSRAILSGDAPRATENPADPVRLALEPGRGLRRLAPGEAAESVDVDVVFPLIHGRYGEDGKLQGALELAGIPYVGSGPLASAAAMDKAVSKRLFAAAGIAVGPWLELRAARWHASRDATQREIREALGDVVFVKPANGGSSIGIRKVGPGDDLDAAVEEALAHDEKVVVERGIDAREIECAVLGNERVEASGLGEIEPSREFYDYEAKYLDGTSRLTIPAELPAALADRMRSLACAAYECLGLRGFARVDFLLDRTSGEPLLNEVNTLPGFTPISMFPKLWEAAGLAYPDLVRRLVDLALGEE